MRLSPQDFRRPGAGVQVYIDRGAGDCVGYWDQEKRSWALRSTQPNEGYPGRGCAKVHPAAGGATSPAAAFFPQTLGHLRQAAENPAAQAAPTYAVAGKLGEARIFGWTHTNPGWTSIVRSSINVTSRQDWRFAWECRMRIEAI